MQKIGWVGLGKLGSVCAAVMAQHHDVVGYDVKTVTLPDYEDGVEYLSPVVQVDMPELVRHSDWVFVAVQTPHEKRLGGELDVESYQATDFEYQYLVNAVRQIVSHAGDKPLDIVIVSTVLPGTTARLLKPLLRGSNCVLVYNPQFIAMGTTVKDFESPEFVLIGADDNNADVASDLYDLVYQPMHNRPASFVSIESAELAKVAYNTFISTKIV